MARYSNWKFSKDKSVSCLQLDPLNPRIPGFDGNRSQIELLHDLLANEDVYNLAKHISTHSFFPNSDVLVMPKPGSLRLWTVLEGNRRLAAIKLLRSPELAPLDQQKRFKTLRGSADLDYLQKINVWTVPDRASAEVYLAMKHAPPEKGLMHEWTPMQKASFYGAFLSDLTVDEIAGRFATTSSQVADHIRTFHLYQMARRLPLKGNARKFWDPRNFPLSVLERIFSNPEARKLLRVQIADGGNYQIESDHDEFLRTYQMILENIGNGSEMLNTRTLDTASDVVARIKDLVGEKPLLKSRRGPALSSGLIESRPPLEGGDEKGPPPTRPQPNPPTPKPKPPKRYGNELFPDKLICMLKKEDRLPAILVELQSLDLKHHNSLAFLLRVSLELALIGWIKKKGEWGNLNAKSNNKKFGPVISEMFRFVKDGHLGQILDIQEANAIKGLLENGQLDTMNGWVHNPNYPSDPAAVQSLATRLRPLLERLISGT